MEQHFNCHVCRQKTSLSPTPFFAPVQCPVCYELITDSDRHRITKCHHYMCSACFTNYLTPTTTSDPETVNCGVCLTAPGERMVYVFASLGRVFPLSQGIPSNFGNVRRYHSLTTQDGQHEDPHFAVCSPCFAQNTDVWGEGVRMG
jgi:hypothetical protein